RFLPAASGRERARIRDPARGGGAPDRDAARRETAARADDLASCLGAVAWRRRAVRARRFGPPQTADVARGPARSRRAALPPTPRPRRRRPAISSVTAARRSSGDIG